MKKNKQQALDRLKKSIFLEGVDSYSDEYAKWKTASIVKRLLGVYEVPAEHFSNTETEAVLKYCGLSNYSVVYYESEFDKEPNRGTAPSVGTGFASSLRDQFGRIRPAVFIRQDVIPLEPSGDESALPQVEDAVRLLILMHELGHAEDIVREVNYNHKDRKINVIDAEVYAHRFVCTYAKRLGYQLALEYYLDNLEQAVNSDDEVSRLAAQRAVKELDMKGLRAATVQHDMKDTAGFKRKLEAAGRYEEVMKKAAQLD